MTTKAGRESWRRVMTKKKSWWPCRWHSSFKYMLMQCTDNDEDGECRRYVAWCLMQNIGLAIVDFRWVLGLDGEMSLPFFLVPSCLSFCHFVILSLYPSSSSNKSGALNRAKTIDFVTAGTSQICHFPHFNDTIY